MQISSTLQPGNALQNGKYRIEKTHFACAIQCKEQRDAKEPTVYVGEGFTTVWLNAAPQPAQDLTPQVTDLPF